MAGGAGLKGRPGLLEAPGDVPVGNVDEDAAGKLLARAFAHSVPLVKDSLLLRWGHPFGRVGLMDAPPQQLVALKARGESAISRDAWCALRGYSVTLFALDVPAWRDGGLSGGS